MSATAAARSVVAWRTLRLWRAATRCSRSSLSNRSTVPLLSGPGGGASAALHLLAPVAVFAVVAGVLLALRCPSEGMETGLWASAGVG